MLPEPNNLLSDFQLALEAEIDAVSSSNHGSFKLVDGLRLLKDDGRFIYRFTISNKKLELRDDTVITIKVSFTQTKGLVVAHVADELTISLDTDIGEKIEEVSASFDNSYLLKRLSSRLSDIGDPQRRGNFNLHLALSAVSGQHLRIRSETILPQSVSDLTSEQKEAVLATVNNRITFIWGPPGTGKTRTLAASLSTLMQRGLRVLVLAQTNSAVDGVILGLCERVQRSNLVSLLDQGKILRLGKLANEDLVKRFGGEVGVDLRIKRESDIIHKNVLALERKLSGFSAEIEILNGSVKLFIKLDKLIKTLSNARERLSNQKRREATFQEEADILTKQILLKEVTQKKAQGMWPITRLIRRINLKQISDDIERLRGQKATIEAKIKNSSKLSAKLESRVAEINDEASHLQLRLSVLNQNLILAAVSHLKDQSNKVLSEIQMNREKISQLKKILIKDCQVLGMTTTMAMLALDHLEGFDVALIDEASMLSVPLAFHSIGLVKESVVIAGDFRQLSPIFTSEDDKASKWLGQDIFESSRIVSKVNQGLAPDNLAKLTTQFRSCETLCNIINKRFYNGDLKTEFSPLSFKELSDEVFTVFGSPISLIDTSSFGPISHQPPGSSSQTNTIHAILIAKICKLLKTDTNLKFENDIGIISPYKAQADLIKLSLDSSGITDATIGTVHKFQGQEKRIIIFDTTVSNSNYLGRFFQASSIADQGARLLNVAFSRAKTNLIVLANLEYFKKNLQNRHLMKDIFSTLQDTGSILTPKNLFGANKNLFSVSTDDNNGLTNTDYFNQFTFPEEIIRAFQIAEDFITLASAFVSRKRCNWFIPYIKSAVSRGVRIEVFLPDPNERGCNGTSGAEVVDVFTDELLSLGVSVYHRRRMHEKILMVDKRFLWSGSANPLSFTQTRNEHMLRQDSLILCEKLRRDLVYGSTKITVPLQSVAY